MEEEGRRCVGLTRRGVAGPMREAGPLGATPVSTGPPASGPGLGAGPVGHGRGFPTGRAHASSPESTRGLAPLSSGGGDGGGALRWAGLGRQGPEEEDGDEDELRKKDRDEDADDRPAALDIICRATVDCMMLQRNCPYDFKQMAGNSCTICSHSEVNCIGPDTSNKVGKVSKARQES